MASSEKHMACRLRPFRIDDLRDLVRLDRRCFSPAIAYDRFEMFYHLTAPGHSAILAVPLEGRPPALLGFVILAAGPAGRKGQIVTLDVNPDHRRCGIGRLLLRTAERHLAESGNREVRLQVAVDNTTAREFYEGLGYEPAERLPEYYPDGTDALELVKQIG
jgi:ribosomal-protein-alanine N-acetyltransferase